jgi:hypothetical protein
LPRKGSPSQEHAPQVAARASAFWRGSSDLSASRDFSVHEPAAVSRRPPAPAAASALSFRGTEAAAAISCPVRRRCGSLGRPIYVGRHSKHGLGVITSCPIRSRPEFRAENAVPLSCGTREIRPGCGTATREEQAPPSPCIIGTRSARKNNGQLPVATPGHPIARDAVPGVTRPRLHVWWTSP